MTTPADYSLIGSDLDTFQNRETGFNGPNLRTLTERYASGVTDGDRGVVVAFDRPVTISRFTGRVF